LKTLKQEANLEEKTWKRKPRRKNLEEKTWKKT